MGREGPFPLILLPQFGGYWIEGTNHEISSIPETEPLQSPTTKVKLECNPTARIYRKHFLAKVSGWLGGRQGPGKGKWLGRHLGIPESPRASVASFVVSNRHCERQSGMVVKRRDPAMACPLARLPGLCLFPHL